MKHLLKRLPLLPALYRSLRLAGDRWRLRGHSVASRFTEIYEQHAWGGRESVSGPGSDPEQTAAIVAALPELFKRLAIRSLLDLPCGDFHWLKRVDLAGIVYLGADIVAPLIADNQRRHAGFGREFRVLDLLVDPLPRADLVLCRDCLVHFSLQDIRLALRAIRASGAEYLLTTTFTGAHANEDIATCRWRPLNLQLAPFRWPPPLQLIDEACPDPQYPDKALGLWRIADITDS